MHECTRAVADDYVPAHTEVHSAPAAMQHACASTRDFTRCRVVLLLVARALPTGLFLAGFFLFQLSSSSGFSFVVVLYLASGPSSCGLPAAVAERITAKQASHLRLVLSLAQRCAQTSNQAHLTVRRVKPAGMVWTWAVVTHAAAAYAGF